MKTLVIQLARLGDILQTLPALNAYCRTHSSEKVDLLVRKKFSTIAHLMPVCSQIIEMDTASILGAIVTNGPQAFEQSEDALQAFVQGLKKEGYTKIINLSFSPFSSYLTYLLTEEGVEVVGYTRHTDGFLAIPDDASAYFYGQVGINRSNRFHLIDLFAAILSVEITELDWKVPLPKRTFFAKSPYIAFHVGASSAKKALSSVALGKLLSAISRHTDKDIYLLGTKEDLAFTTTIMSQQPSTKIKNLVGTTTLSELIDIIAGADLFIGADSGPLQVCNLTNTVCLNFSNDFVNFWETGPRSEKSYICYSKDFALLDMNQIAIEVQHILAGQQTNLILGDRMGYYGPYPSTATQDFQWEMIKAIYLSGEFPQMQSSSFAKAIVHLNDVNDISIHHLTNFQMGNRQQASVLETADQIMDSLATEVEEITPLVYWFRTEKIRMGPMPLTDLIAKYLDLHKKLKQVLDIYLKPKWEISEDLL